MIDIADSRYFCEQFITSLPRHQGLSRIYGEATSDCRVDISDFGLFSLAYLTPANYSASLDSNNDGRIDIAVFGQFSMRFFSNLP